MSSSTKRLHIYGSVVQSGNLAAPTTAIYIRTCVCVCVFACFNTETRVREGEGRGAGRRLILQKLVRFSPRELERNTSVPTKFSRNT